MQPLSEQLVAFLLLIVLGLLLGFLYDCYRLIRWIRQPKARGTMLGDALFWLLITAISYHFLLIFNWGEVRVYVFLALICGLLLYHKLLSRKTRSCLMRIYLILRRVIVRLAGLLLFPLRIIWYTITLPYRICRFLILALTSGGHRIAVIFIWPIRRWGRRNPPPPEQDC